MKKAEIKTVAAVAEIRNITVPVNYDLYHAVRMVAAGRDQSVASMVREVLTEMVSVGSDAR